jgi:hypothetical protein
MTSTCISLLCLAFVARAMVGCGGATRIGTDSVDGGHDASLDNGAGGSSGAGTSTAGAGGDAESDASSDVGAGGAAGQGTTTGAGGSPPRDGAGGASVGGMGGQGGAAGKGTTTGMGGSPPTDADGRSDACGIGGSAPPTEGGTADATRPPPDGGSPCTKLVRSGEPLDLTELGWASVAGGTPWRVRGDLIATADPSTVAGVGVSDVSDPDSQTHYTFFSPWGAWDRATVFGPSSVSRFMWPVCTGVGKAFEGVVNYRFVQRIPAEGCPGTPADTLAKSFPYFLTKLPNGFLLGSWSESFQPQPPRQPFIVGVFQRVTQVDDDGNVIGPGNQLVGCTPPFGGADLFGFDAIPIEGGQFIAVQSVASSPDACPPDDQRVSGETKIHLVRRTSAGALEETWVYNVPATSLHLFARGDGAWLVIANSANGDVARVSTIHLVRLDKRGVPLTPLIALPAPPGAVGGEFVAGASLGDRLFVAVGFSGRYVLELLDEGGGLSAFVDTPQLIGLASSTLENRALVTHTSRLPDGRAGPMELSRYDCAAGP